MSVLSFRVSTGVRKAAAVIQTSITNEGPPHLYMVNLQEKIISEAMEGVSAAKEEGVTRVRQWAEKDNNVPIRECLIKLAQIEQIEVKLHRKYTEQCEVQRKCYKRILDSEKGLDKLRKQLETHKLHVQKVQKKVTETSRKRTKGENKKLNGQNVELAKAVSQMELCGQELQQQELAHETFKSLVFSLELLSTPSQPNYDNLHEMLKAKVKSDTTLHQSMLQTTEAKKRLVQLYTSRPFLKITPETMATAQRESTRLITALEQSLDISISPLPSADSVTNASPLPPQPAPPQPLPAGATNSPVGRPRLSIPAAELDPASQRPLPPLPPEDEYLTPVDESYVDMNQSRTNSARNSMGSQGSQGSNVLNPLYDSTFPVEKNPSLLGAEHNQTSSPAPRVSDESSVLQLQEQEYLRMNSLYNAISQESPVPSPRTNIERTPRRASPAPRLQPRTSNAELIATPNLTGNGIAASYHEALGADPLSADKSYIQVDPNKPLFVYLPSDKGPPPPYPGTGYVSHSAVDLQTSGAAQPTPRVVHSQEGAEDDSMYVDVEETVDGRRHSVRRSFTGQLDTYDIAKP